MSIKGLEKLEAWRKSKDFALRIYREVLPVLPKEEKWAMDQQLRRSASSIPANIAEGHGRYYFQDNVRFCFIARGSLEETLSHIILAHDLGFISQELYNALEIDGENLNRLINGYIAYLKKSKLGANEPGGSNPQIREADPIYLVDIPEDDSES
jgi:four helix bundle protein